jgi:hypothetical protein
MIYPYMRSNFLTYQEKRVTETCFERRKLGNPWRQHKLAGLMLYGGDPV